MKTIIDYLKKNKTFDGDIGGHAIKISTDRNNIVMDCDDSRYVFNAFNGSAASRIQDILYAEYEIEVRFCDECGIPYDMGFIAGDGDWYCCQGCFERAMNYDYGEEGWRSSDEEGEYGGFYEFLNDNGEWEDTGIYYTEWN